MAYARVALRFDLSSITEPVTSAELRLFVLSTANNGTCVCSLFTIASDITFSEATWVNASLTTPWDLMGGDRNIDDFITAVAMPSSSMEIYDVTPMVNDIITGAKPNRGFIIEPATTPDLSDAMQDHFFASSENSLEQIRPSLVLQVGSDISVQKESGLLHNLSYTIQGSDLIIKSDERNAVISLIDLQGRIVQQTKIVNGVSCIKNANTGTGLRLLRIDFENRSVTLPIVVK